VYPEVLVRTGFLSENSWITRGLSWCSKWLYERMERVIVIGRDMQELVAARLDDAAERIVLIPNFGDRDQIVPTPKDTNGVLEQLGLRDKFVVQYSGNLGRTHGLNHVMEAAQRLEQTSDVHFLFIGAGAMRNWILATCERLAIRNVSVLGYVQRNELTVSLNACDVSLVSFAQGMAGVSVPSRMYNILAAGKPIIAVADESSELARVVREAEVGWVVPPGQPDLIAAAVLEAQRSPERLIEMGLNARRASEQFTLARVVASYRNLIDDVAGPLSKRDVDPLPFSDQAAPPPPERAPAYSEPGTVAPR